LRRARLLAHASGHLDFLAAPENVDTDVFDLEDGVMDEKSLLVDTTEMLVRGDASVDFGEERVYARLTPAPKKAEFLSLQTRVEVKGSFDDFGIGVPPEELVATVLRFVTSIVVVPVQWIFLESPPADGEKTCLEAWLEPRE
jgi:hypothetical protein